MKFNAAITGRCIALKFPSFNGLAHPQRHTDNGFLHVADEPMVEQDITNY